jgi:hypothetical protein
MQDILFDCNDLNRLSFENLNMKSAYAKNQTEKQSSKYIK